MSNELHNAYSSDRLDSRIIDELIGLTRGLIADGVINQAEVELLQKWIAATGSIADHPVLSVLYRRVSEVLADGIVDEEEKVDLFDTLSKFSNGDFELGETLKSSTLPLCTPFPSLAFNNVNYCFTGTFNFGQRKHCEQAIVERGGLAGGLTKKTDILVIGVYATDSWKHSAFGNKIVKAAEMRSSGMPIRIVSEEHWVKYL
jgi:NAD-dependent DNA ligase